MALQYCAGTSPSASHGRKGTEILRKDIDPDLPWKLPSPGATENECRTSVEEVCGPASSTVTQAVS